MMTRIDATIVAGTLLAFTLGGPAAWAAASPGAKCEATKVAVTAAYSACLHRAKAKLAATSGTCSTSSADCFENTDCPVSESCTKNLEKYTAATGKCVARFDAKIAAAVAAAAAKGAVCHDSVDSRDVDAILVNTADEVASALDGGSPPLIGSSCTTALGNAEACGNGLLDGFESCDFEVAGFFSTCGEVAGIPGGETCTADCEVDHSGCASCAAAGGTADLRACFFLGEFGDSCAVTCAARGLLFDPVGSQEASRSSSTCDALLRRLVDPVIGLTALNCELNLGSDFGCSATASSTPGAFRTQHCADTGPVPAGSASASVRRVCGCREP